MSGRAWFYGLLLSSVCWGFLFAAYELRPGGAL